MKKKLARFGGSDEISRALNAYAEAIERSHVTVEAPLEIVETPGGRSIRLRRRPASAVSVSRVVVIAASETGPAEFDTLTYTVALIDGETSIPELGANPEAETYRTCPFVRFGETFNGEPWRVDPARPGTFGVAESFPVYDGATPTGESKLVVRLFDERPVIAGCG